MKGNTMNEKNKTEIDALAELSKLEFNKAESAVLEKELADFFDLIIKVDEIDLNSSQGSDLNDKNTNVFRCDVVESSYTSAEMLANAKTQADGYITVPKVMEG